MTETAHWLLHGTMLTIIGFFVRFTWDDFQKLKTDVAELKRRIHSP